MRNPVVFEKFYKENFKKVWLRCKRGGFSDVDSDDITQNIFYRLWVKYDDDYILYNVGYFWKYLVNYEIINFVIHNEKYNLLKSSLPCKVDTDNSVFELIEFIRDNLKNKKELKFFNKLLTIGRAGLDKIHKRDTRWWNKYKKYIRGIAEKY